MKILTKISAAIMLSLSMSAHAGAIIDWEGTSVDFYSTWLNAVTLRIEIDAASPTAGWTDAVNIDTIAINAPDAWDWANVSDIPLSGPVSTISGFSSDINGIGFQNLTENWLVSK